MEIQVFDSYASLSEKAADEVIQALQLRERPLFCVASGDTPKGLYRILAERCRRGQADISGWYFLGLDEWLGLGGDDPGSCRYMLEEDLIRPLGVQPGQCCFFDGRTKDPEAECSRVEAFIRQHGPIDLAVLGLGMNGHIGLNEPGTPASLRSHVSVIDPVTAQVGQKYFVRPQSLTQGITLGMATLMEAARLLLLINGEKKSAVLQQALEGEITPALPASLLRRHPHYTVYTDAGAAGMLHRAF
ncbi:glucosamine-6-phosphate deaminase [Compostibacter hankyongensis]|uniref:Glucosamine-6-phosphate deaminase n=1 Tax=Compostibacter hankyongensis TaxID=1007089 RepID=A0ABP8FFG8_9BACT